MCGIVAVYSPRGMVSPDRLDRAVARLHHRGPDGSGTWISPDGRVGLGHSRLSIIDLKTGAQPIGNEDERDWIVANGEFYDFEPMQRRLVDHGHHLRTRSDSEIALHLYEDLGPQCLHHLRGEYAFAVWDETHQHLFAARDRFGVKPLFFAQHEDTIYLASEVKALFAAGLPASWDFETVHHGAAFRRPDRSYFKGISIVPPGHYLIADHHGVRLYPYWDMDYPEAADFPQPESDEAAIAQFREILDDAVKTRLRADVPVGCYLSGGLDSCAVLGLAQQHLDRPIRAFTLSFDHADYDEREIAREMAARAGSEFTVIPVTQDELADNLPDGITSCENFCFNAHGVAKYMLSRAVRDAGYKVVLTGEGSDEMMAGYPHWRQDMIMYNSAGQDPDEIASLLEQLREANKVSAGILLPEEGEDIENLSAILASTLGFVPTWMVPQLRVVAARAALCNPDMIAPHEDRDLPAHLFSALDIEGQVRGRDPVHQSLYLWGKTALPDYILTVLGDRMEMAHSIEGRVPFLDHHVAEYLSRIPVNLKIRGMTEKYILREATKHVLTDTVYRRQKHPFLSPPAALNPGGRLHELTQDTLRGKDMESVSWLDPKAVRGFMDTVDSMTDEKRVQTDPIIMWMMSGVFLQKGLGLES
jgi:asparagine synthase (glutamine-hydrolysing)